MTKEELLEKLGNLHVEIIEIVTNRTNYYIDDLDILDSDINSDIENDIFTDMTYEELIKYINNVENILNFYKESESEE